MDYRTKMRDFEYMGNTYRVYGAYNDDTPKFEYDYFDIYSVDSNGQETLLTAEMDFPEMPTEGEVINFVCSLG